MNKVKISTNKAIPGMVAADNVYTFNNQLLISTGTALTDKVITRLKFYSIRQLLVYVPDETSESLPTAPVNTQFYSEKVMQTEEFEAFTDSLSKTTSIFKDQLENLANGAEEINTDELFAETQNILGSVRNGAHLFDMLHCLRNNNDETFAHSVNVALICNALAKWLNFGRKDIETATLSGLLHDIGKLTIPKELLEKEEKLSEEEYEVIRKHALQGYNILQKQDISIHVKMSAMMHHERCDGSGYPMGIQGVQIDRFAKLVMIADVYDAMTSARVYRGAICPFEVLSIFTSDGLSKFDTKCLMTFTEHVYHTYLNNTVQLSDNQIGTIVMMNQYSLTKPVIELADKTFIDLSRENNLYIAKIL